MKIPSTRPKRHEIPPGFVDALSLDENLIHVTPLYLVPAVKVGSLFTIRPDLGAGHHWQPQTPHEPLEVVNVEEISGEQVYTLRSHTQGNFRLFFDPIPPKKGLESREYAVFIEEDLDSEHEH